MAKVYLHVYEVTKGLAAQLSAGFLGRHIRGVWHTGVVCFGTEYCFGSGGIMQMNPGETVIGAPDEVVDLGETHVSFDLFHEFLFAIGADQFRPEKYNLFEHNCNNFSNEVTQFLTGKKIPSYILDLPTEVANTPIGSMMKSFMSCIGSPVAGRSDGTARPLAVSSTQPRNSNDVYQSQQNTAVPGASVDKKNIRGESPISFEHDVGECCARFHHLFGDEQEIIKTIAMDSKGKSDEDLERAICTLEKSLNILEEKNEAEYLTAFIDILSILSLQNGLMILKMRKGSILFNRTFDAFKRCSSRAEVAPNILKLGSNLFNDQEHRDWLSHERSEEVLGVKRHFIGECVEHLLSPEAQGAVVDAALALSYNVSLAKLDEESEIEISSALLHWISTGNKDSLQARRCVSAVKNFIRSNQQVRELAEMTVDPSVLEL